MVRWEFAYEVHDLPSRFWEPEIPDDWEPPAVTGVDKDCYIPFE